jgi:hypothetical protein
MTTTGRYRWGLLVIVLGYVGLSLAVTDLHRNLAYDEAIYLSQVYPGPALPFTAPRARGLQLLLIPLGWFDAPIPVVRGYLLAVEATLMYLGFNAWVPVLRGRAPAAAAVFAVGWLPLFYAIEVFPNLPVAFGTVAAAGYLARYQSGRSGRPALIACAVAVALVALVRPTEAVFITAGLCLVATTRPGRELAVRWGLPMLGLAVGWVPWLVEAQLRFGGPLNRLAAASTNVGGGFHPGNVRQHLGFTDGPVSGTVQADLPWPGEVWWLLLALAVVVPLGRLALGSAEPRQRAASIAAVVGVVSASQYLLFTQVLEARFLLPTYAVLSVALVATAPSPLHAWRVSGRRVGRATDPVADEAADPVADEMADHAVDRVMGRVVGVLLVVTFSALFVLFAGWQIVVAERVDREQAVARELAQTLAHVVRSSVTPPCVLSGEVAFPVIAFETGCRGAPFHPDSPDITVAGLPLGAPMPPVYVLTTTNPSRTGVHPVPASAQELSSFGAPGWWLFIATPNEVFAAS